MDTQEVITNMIDKIIAGDNTSAHDDFESLISSKMAAALDQRKLEVAQSLYGSNEVDQNSDQETEVDETEQ